VSIAGSGDGRREILAACGLRLAVEEFYEIIFLCVAVIRDSIRQQDVSKRGTVKNAGSKLGWRYAKLSLGSILADAILIARRRKIASPFSLILRYYYSSTGFELNYYALYISGLGNTALRKDRKRTSVD